MQKLQRNFQKGTERTRTERLGDGSGIRVFAVPIGGSELEPLKVLCKKPITAVAECITSVITVLVQDGDRRKSGACWLPV